MEEDVPSFRGGNEARRIKRLREDPCGYRRARGGYRHADSTGELAKQELSQARPGQPR